MTRACPEEARLTRYVDRDLSPEDSLVLSEHVSGCARCREHVDALRTVLGALQPAALPPDELRSHVNEVMARLDLKQPAAIRGRDMRVAWLALAACVGLSFSVFWLRQPSPWQARGGSAAPTIARDIGVQAYAFDGDALRPLTPGAEISRSTPLGAGFRNLGVTDAYLLLFAVDAHDVVHWISPRYVSAERDPEATRLALTTAETLLRERVIFDDLAAGSLRIVSVVTPQLAHVSDIEALEVGGASRQAITQRLPHAEVRELRVIVKGNEP